MKIIATDAPAGRALNAWLLTVDASRPGDPPPSILVAAMARGATDAFTLPERAALAWRFVRRHGARVAQHARN